MPISDTSETDFLTLIQKLIGIQNKECAEVNVFTVIKSWFIDYNTKEQPLYACGERLRKIICIWFCVYLILAIPLWCTRGKLKTSKFYTHFEAWRYKSTHFQTSRITHLQLLAPPKHDKPLLLRLIPLQSY